MSLEECVKNPVKYTGGKIDSIFMYVKNYCPHSIHAALRTEQFTTDVKCYDLCVPQKYVSHSDLDNQVLVELTVWRCLSLLTCVVQCRHPHCFSTAWSGSSASATPNPLTGDCCYTGRGL